MELPDVRLPQNEVFRVEQFVKDILEVTTSFFRTEARGVMGCVVGKEDHGS